jgi:hypothetical protein
MGVEFQASKVLAESCWSHNPHARWVRGRHGRLGWPGKLGSGELGAWDHPTRNMRGCCPELERAAPPPRSLSPTWALTPDPRSGTSSAASRRCTLPPSSTTARHRLTPPPRARPAAAAARRQERRSWPRTRRSPLRPAAAAAMPAPRRCHRPSRLALQRRLLSSRRCRHRCTWCRCRTLESSCLGARGRPPRRRRRPDPAPAAQAWRTQRARARSRRRRLRPARAGATARSAAPLTGPPLWGISRFIHRLQDVSDPSNFQSLKSFPLKSREAHQ